MASSVSLSFTVTTFSFLSTNGVDLVVGDMITSCDTLSSSTNSLNTSSILLPVKFSAESFGLDFTNLGGMESIGPPPGGMILAQPECSRHNGAKKNMNSIYKDDLLNV